MANGADVSAVAALPCSALSAIARLEVEEISPQALKDATSTQAAHEALAMECHRLPAGEVDMPGCGDA